MRYFVFSVFVLLIISGCGGGGGDSGSGTSAIQSATVQTRTIPRGNVAVSLKWPVTSSSAPRKAQQDSLSYIFISLFSSSGSEITTGGSALFNYSAHEGTVECLAGNYFIGAMGMDADYQTRYVGILGNINVVAQSVTQTAPIPMEPGTSPSPESLASAGLPPSAASWNWSYSPDGGFNPSSSPVMPAVLHMTVLPWDENSLDIYFDTPFSTAFNTCTIMRRTDRFAESPTDGTVIVQSPMPPGSEIFISDPGATGTGTVYYYSVFTSSGEVYSSAVKASAKVSRVSHTDRWMDIGGSSGQSYVATGDRIRVFDSAGVFCGKTVVSGNAGSGNFDIIHCYFDDTTGTPSLDEGGSENENMTVFINRHTAQSTPQAVWNSSAGQMLTTLSISD